VCNGWLSAILEVTFIFAAGKKPDDPDERFIDTEVQNSGKSPESARAVANMVSSEYFQILFDSFQGKIRLHLELFAETD
jgi:hypothetical protein